VSRSRRVPQLRYIIGSLTPLPSPSPIVGEGVVRTSIVVFRNSAKRATEGRPYGVRNSTRLRGSEVGFLVPPFRGLREAVGGRKGAPPVAESSDRSGWAGTCLCTSKAQGKGLVPTRTVASLQFYR